MNKEKEPSGQDLSMRWRNIGEAKINIMAEEPILERVVGGRIPLVSEYYFDESEERKQAILELIQWRLGLRMALDQMRVEDVGEVIEKEFSEHKEDLFKILQVVKAWRLVDESVGGEITLNAFTADGVLSRQVAVFGDELERLMTNEADEMKLVGKLRLWEAWYYYFETQGVEWCYLLKEEDGIKRESLWWLGEAGEESRMGVTACPEEIKQNGFEVIMERTEDENECEIVEVIIQKVDENSNRFVVDRAIHGYEEWGNQWREVRRREIKGWEGKMTYWVEVEDREDGGLANVWLEWEDGRKMVGKVVLRDYLLPAQEIVTYVLEEVSGGVSERELGRMWREYPTLNLRSEDQRNREIFGEVLVVIYKGKKKVRLEKLMVGGVVLEGKLSQGDGGEWLIEAEIPKGVMVRSGTSWDWDGQRVEDKDDIPPEEERSMVRVWLDEDTGEVSLEIVYKNGN